MQNDVLRVKGKGDDIIAKFTKIVANSNEEYTRIPQLSTGMVLLSGRRIAELLSGDVRLSEGSTDMSVIFQESSTARPVEIPLLCSFNTFRHGMGVLSKLQGGKRLTRLQVKKKYQAAVNYYVEKHFSFTVSSDVVSVNDLRYIYATMAFKKYNYSSLGLTYQEFLTWISNLTGSLAIPPSPDITILGATKKIPVAKRMIPPKRWMNRVKHRKL